MRLPHAVTNLTVPLILGDRYGYHSSNGYYLNNNIWGVTPSSDNNQTTSIDAISSAGVSWHVDWTFASSNSSNSTDTSEDGSSDYEVKSYPYAGVELEEKSLVKDIGSLWTKAEWDYFWPGDVGRANVAIDIFTAEDEDRDISGGDYEVMIWLAKYSSAHPIGTSHGNVSICDEPWELFIGHNGETKVFSFIAPETRKTWETDVKPFFDHIEEEHDFPSDEQHLTAWQFGTEAFVGEGRFRAWYWMAEATYLD